MRIILNKGNRIAGITPEPVQQPEETVPFEPETIIPTVSETVPIDSDEIELERVIPEPVDVQGIHEVTEEFVNNIQKESTELDMDPRENDMTKTDYHQFISTWTITNLRKKAKMLNIPWEKHWKKRDFIIFIVDKVYGKGEEKTNAAS